MTKKEQLEKLNKQMSMCSNCALRCTASRVVFGGGNPEAEILFIGEAPGKKEDELGIPFVGAAGKFLNEMLETIKLKREDIYPHTKTTDEKSNSKKNIPSNNKKDFGVGVYIANVCKCRPPENRDPLPEEIKECWPWLEKQIEIIDPKIIITLGRHSLNRFYPEAKISQAHGKLFKKTFPNIGTRYFFALYHPAAALYNGSMREILTEDFKKIPLILKKIKKEQ